ncbi:hypothetical protein NDU88_003054 [Pleurodeles waltl]|uniref:Uncharacterized protein n=1 Tax=Pleurodeles waltl TaxID=8319 RepID=A0AAV7TMI3_PLEWA|nr:hypothetical protein NDU88_003054 [Pleurodeles waltl]
MCRRWAVFDVQRSCEAARDIRAWHAALLCLNREARVGRTLPASPQRGQALPLLIALVRPAGPPPPLSGQALRSSRPPLRSCICLAKIQAMSGTRDSD